MELRNLDAGVLHLSILFCLLFLQFSISKRETPDYSHVCSTEYGTLQQIKDFRFNCSVIESSSQKYTTFCKFIDHRFLSVFINEIRGRASIICSSNYPITVNVKFQHGIVSQEYLNMTWRREIVDINDTATYAYHLHIFPPKRPIRHFIEAVLYTLSILQYPAETIDILWCVDYGNWHVLYWMEDKQELQIDDLRWTENIDAVNIPCFSLAEIKLRKHADNRTQMLRYNYTSYGILLYANENRSDMSGNYTCFNEITPSSFSVDFSIVTGPSEYSSSYRLLFNDSYVLAPKVAFMNTKIDVPFANPKRNSIIRNRPFWSIKYGNFNTHALTIEADGWEYELKCQLKGRTPLFVISFHHLMDIFSPPYDNSTIYCDSAISKTIDLSDNQTVYTAACNTSNLQIDKPVTYFCVDEKTDTILEAWTIVKVTELVDSYWHLSKSHELECTGYEDIILQDLYCSNPIICKFMENILQNQKSCNIKTSCQGEPSRNCARIKLSQNGIIHCQLREIRQRGTEYTGNVVNNFWNVYFVGLKKRTYFGINAEPPKEAIINLQNVGPNEPTMINNDPVKLTFYCEAHSFFFEEGIRWLFEYKNGSKQLIPSEYLSDYACVTLKQNCFNVKDPGNPSSTVNIMVADKNVKKIICAAPRLSVLKLQNFKEWVFESLEIRIYDAIAPSIVQTSTKFSFDIGDSNKDIKCQATGLPKPEIQWLPLSGQKLSRDLIIDVSLYSVVRFPIYDESYEGDYLCTATSAAGNESKIISVHTNGSILSGTQLALISSTVILLIASIAATIYWYIRKLKMKQSMEMEEILQLLRGNTDENTNNVLEMPYNNQWDLEKHSFCIDQSKILGCGEFGIVYKGTIAKLNSDVAFKSLKSSGNAIHLKSLVSELKLLMYIGKHENIVELHGAYTQDVKKGVIYVAIEFCALGSLERHLRSNKERFQKCPFLASYFVDSNKLPELTSDVSATTNYTIKSLLKWCSEIANAMDYLYSKKVVHGDLATRNILLTADWNTKLTDFGLSRRTYYSDEYKKVGKDPLPWRWLALESLLTNVFNVKTDVWAFGITLWEIFSLGELPYPGLSPTMEFVGELERGLRNPRPKYASSALYEVMIACWTCDRNERPSFASLRLLFERANQMEAFQVNAEDMKPIGSTEEEAIEYFELEEITTNEETI